MAKCRKRIIIRGKYKLCNSNKWEKKRFSDCKKEFNREQLNRID